MSWGALVKIGTAIMGKSYAVIKGSGKVIANMTAKSPQMVNGAGQIVHTLSRPVIYATKNPKTAIVAPGVAYAGWKALVDKQPVLDSAKEYGKGVLDVAIGKEDSDEITDSVGRARDTLNDIKETATEGKSLISSLSDSLGGINSFIKNITSGEGLNMFGNFFGNIGKGNVSGMSIIGLLAAGLLTFGRFGWMGKIAGALLGMMMIGNNSNVSQSQSSQMQMAQNTESASRGMHR